MARSLAARVKVVGPTIAVGVLLATLATCSGTIKQDWRLDQTVWVWTSVLAGPFGGLWATATWGWADVVVWSAMCLFATAAHPLYPGSRTSWLSAMGVGLWFFLGFDGE